MKICVRTQPGARGEREPHAFQLGGRRVPVVAILERWETPTQRYFRVRDDDGRRFVLRHNEDSGDWELEAVYGPAPAPRLRLSRTPA